MPSHLHKQRTLALLIDAENAASTLTRPLLLRAASYGQLAVRRAYGDWSRPGLHRHKGILRKHAIEAVQLFDNATGKNSADIAMVIDAVDLINTGQFDGFCIASSDSDFTQLAIRMRGEDLQVYGFGARHTPQSFVQACTRFIYVESLGW